MFKGKKGQYSKSLNTPIVMHKVGKPQHVSKADILQFLDKFIQDKESLIESNNITQSTVEESTQQIVINMDTNLTSALSQLKRIQRDFKGLPPISFDNEPKQSKTVEKFSNEENEKTDVMETNENGDKVTKSRTGGTKVTFD